MANCGPDMLANLPSDTAELSMFTEFEISGYKGFEKLKLDGLKRITLVGGKNNVGKTSVLEAMFLSLDWANPELLTRHFGWRGTAGFAPTAESAWSSSFFNFDLGKRIELTSRDPAGDRETLTIQTVKESKSSFESRRKAPIQRSGPATVLMPGQPTLRVTGTKGSKPFFESTVAITQGVPPFSINVSTYSREPLVANFSPARFRTGANELAIIFGELDKDKRTGELVKSLNIIEPRLLGLSVVPNGTQSEIYGDIEGMSSKIPINLLGDGIGHLMEILLHISKCRGGYFLVDEFENGFHHSLLPEIWKVVFEACADQRCQLIATTHSYECLASFSKALTEVGKDNFSYIRLDKTSKGISPTLYDAASLNDAVESGWEVR